jgi:AAHS family 4-hydroxybenzoate transporter-like MFS transporter
MAITFSEAMNRAPLRAFQVATFVICMLVLTCDGIDAQLLGIVAPKIIADFGVDKATFGVAMGAALFGFGIGSWGGGWLGDTIGRRWSLAIAAAVFSLATIGAAMAGDVWGMVAWRFVGGLGFGSAYANAIALAGEWLPDRWRSVAVTTLSVGTPAGGTIVGWVAPTLVIGYGWRTAFVAFGMATLLVVVLIVAALRDSPSFLLARGKRERAQATAGALLREQVELVPERHVEETDGGGAIGVLHRSNLRLNIGIGIAFTACALCAYGILNWSTTFLTAHGFTLSQAGNAVSIGGLTSIAASIAAGLLVYRFGSKTVIAAISGSLFVMMILFALAVQRLPAVPSADDRLLVIVVMGATAAIFSAGMASMYAMLTHGYPPSCRSAGIGFGILMGRVGAISGSTFGGALLDLGHGSVYPFFAVMAVGALLISSAAFVVDRPVPPSRKKPAALPGDGLPTF